MNSFGGYSSLDMQQRQVASAFGLAQQRGRMQGGMATATSGYSPYFWPNPAMGTPLDAPATVMTEAKSAPERKRASFKSQAIYWAVMAALSVLSIWPAWAPAKFSVPWAYAPQELWYYAHVPLTAQTRQWKIEMKNGDMIHAVGDRLGLSDKGNPEVTLDSKRVWADWNNKVFKITEEPVRVPTDLR